MNSMQICYAVCLIEAKPHKYKLGVGPGMFDWPATRIAKAGVGASYICLSNETIRMAQNNAYR